MKITAAVSRRANAPFTIEQVELDEPRPDEVLVRIAGVGLCHTDLAARAGVFGTAFPAVFGHEGAGIVERVGAAVRKVAPGDRVALSFLSCGHCPSCDKDSPAYCHSMAPLNFPGVRADGSRTLRDAGGAISGSFFGQSSFATYALASERNTVKLPNDGPLEIMGTLGCGVQTGAGAVMRSLACTEGTSLVVLGGGAVGLSAVLGAVLRRLKTIIVVEPHAARRALALELGATHAIDPAAGDIAQALAAIAPAGVDYALDTTAVLQVIESAVACLAPRGSFGFIGVPADPLMKLPGTLRTALRSGHTFRGIMEGDSDPDVFIPELIEHYRAGRFAFDKLVKTYPLSDINRAISDQHDGVCVKAVLLTGA
jgi:aryl-alcohol dehydrogenase